MNDLPLPPSPHALPALPSLRYGQVRRRWFWSRLVALLRKWAIYIVMGLAIFGAFSVGATTSMAALTAWTVALVFQSTQWPWHQALACALGHGLAGVGVVLAFRPVLWSGAWLEAERALPIAPREMQASDASLVLLCLLPLFGVYVAGALTWTVQSPAWLQGSMAAAWGWLAVSMATSAAGGWMAVAGARAPARTAVQEEEEAPDSSPSSSRHPSPHSVHGGASASAGGPAALRPGKPLKPLRPWSALIAAPIWRGPARGLGAALLAFVLGTVATLAFIANSGAHLASWGLAGLGLWTLVATARLHQLQGEQLLPLHEAACEALPIPARRLLTLRRGLTALPAMLALLALPLLWACAPLAVRPIVAVLFWLAFAALHAWHTLVPPHDSQSQVSRWLGALIVLAALASEVYAA